MRWLILAVLSICATRAQVYSIQTLAGGGLPENTPCNAASLGGIVEGIAADAAGNLFIPLYQLNVVVRCDVVTGMLTRVAGTGAAGFSDGENVPATGVRITNPTSVALDAAGNVYIAETGRVRKVSKGIVTTIAGTGIAGVSGDGGPAVAAQVSPRAIAVDRTGNVFIADSGRVREVIGGVINTVAGGPLGPLAQPADNVPATSVVLNPIGVAVDLAGNLYIADVQGGVRKVANGVMSTLTPAVTAYAVAVDASGKVYVASTYQISELTGGVLTAVTANDGGALLGQAVAVDAAGNVYFPEGYSDYYDFLGLDFRTRIRKGSNGFLTTVAGDSYTIPGNGPPTAAQLGTPSGVALDSAGNIYFSESDANRVVELSNGVLTTIAGNGTLGFAGDGGPATDAQLAAPAGIAIDSRGALYIADTHNQRIRKVVNGVITTVAGNGTRSIPPLDGTPALGPTLYFPAHVAVDGADNLYYTDENASVRKISGGVITMVACSGKYGYVGDNVPAITAQCKAPGAMVFDQTGNLYFADTGNGYVREVTTDGMIHNVAGIGKTQGDGIAAVNALIAPQTLAVDATGNIYIGEPETIRKISNGVIHTIAGGGEGDGLAMSNAIGAINGMAVDSQGRIYFSDSGQDEIRALVPQSGAPVSIASVENAASNLQSWVVPGEILVITGTGLGPASLTMGTLTLDGVFDTQIAGASVDINGVPAPMIYASDRQVAAVAPYRGIMNIPGVLNQITVTYQGSVSKPFRIAGAQWVLGLFTSDSSGAGQAAAINQDGTLNSPSHPAAAGSYISLYATGEGVTKPGGMDGKLASAPLPIPAAAIIVTIGGKTVTPSYAGGAPGEVAGLMQVNVQIPANVAPGNAVPVTVEVPGYSTTQPGVTIAVGK